MVWADKLAKANASAAEMLRKARRTAANPDMNSMDDFLNQMDIGDPDPSQHVSKFDGAVEIAEWFHQEHPDDWRQRD